MAQKPKQETRRNLYVGGLHEEIDEVLLRSAFIPFGDLVDVNVPLDMSAEGPQKRNRGFGFVTFDLPEDALAAIDNMNDSEMYGRRIRVNFARDAPGGGPGKAVWADPDKWAKENIGEGDARVIEADRNAPSRVDDGLKPKE
eukprot:Plantae.Rhodophyta-Rhodochaete_pulchella.ctg9071.p2 GENE.Plantae.Rhodophyta-Rhodochaete_pulchella.ctg9071~~Plantae.Rhodophyta-Rhodochaete_pulchella.ctg9071.p2  ORF type:complete len:142 (+),score=22.06 Plantae.Rhodophyta-Rhodochaete_pulchella.ctg9071:103-528(+)